MHEPLFPPSYEPPEPTAAELDRHAAEEADRKARLTAFAAAFDKDPETYARVLIALAVAGRGEVGMEPSDLDVSLQMTEERLGDVLSALSLGEFCTAIACDDGGEEGPPTHHWAEYIVQKDAMTMLLTHGARRWIEQVCATVRPQPELAGVTQSEVDAYAERCRDRVTVDGVIAHFAGTGDTQRPIDRAMVAEVLLRRAIHHAGLALAALTTIGREAEQSAWRARRFIDDITRHNSED